MSFHQQCLIRNTEGSKQTAWIPSEIALEGRGIGLKINGEWERNWMVEKAYGVLLDSDYVAEHERAFKNHRKATDI